MPLTGNPSRQTSPSRPFWNSYVQPNPGVSTERTGEEVTYSLGVRWRKGGLCKWTAGKTQPPSSRASSCRPGFSVDERWLGQRGRQGGLHHVPGYGGQGGMGVNRKVQGVGLGPVEEREREEAGLSFLPCCQRLLLKLSIL